MGTRKSTVPEDEDRTVVYLGNRDAIEVLTDDDGNSERRALPTGKRATKVIMPAGQRLMDAALDLTHPSRGIWNAHSDADAPAWVASNNQPLAQLLASHWGCELRDFEPEGEPAPADDDDVEG